MWGPNLSTTAKALLRSSIRSQYEISGGTAAQNRFYAPIKTIFRDSTVSDFQYRTLVFLSVAWGSMYSASDRWHWHRRVRSPGARPPPHTPPSLRRHAMHFRRLLPARGSRGSAVGRSGALHTCPLLPHTCPLTGPGNDAPPCAVARRTHTQSTQSNNQTPPNQLSVAAGL